MKFVAALAAALAAVSLSASAVRAAPMFIDSFTQGASTYTATAPGDFQGAAAVQLSNGVSRQVQLLAPTFAVDGLDSITTRVFTGSGGIFDYASSAGADAETLITYRIDPTQQLEGLTSGYAFRLDFAALDAPAAGNTTVRLTLNAPGKNEYDSSTITLTQGGAQTVDIPLTGLAPNYPGTTTIQFYVDAPTGADYRLNAISLVAVPEPAALALLGGGTLLALRRRRTAAV